MVLASVVNEGGGLQVPSLGDMFEWPNFLWDGKFYAMNKVSALCLAAMVIGFLLWFIAARRAQLVPRGLQTLMEPLYEFIRNNIVIDVIGPKGLPYVPFLASLFTFILICNLFEVTWPLLFPPTSAIAIPLFLTVIVWLVYIVQGIATQGPWGYLKSMIPPGVPVAILPLVFVIELVSTLFVRPLSLAVRLFANMVAGHTLITMFLVFTLYNFGWPDSGGEPFARGVIGILVGIVSFIGATGMFGFEIFVGFIQAFIFTMLTAVYVDSSMNPAH